MTVDDMEAPGTKQIKCTLGVTTIRYLGMLSRTGTHGNNIPDVMKGQGNRVKKSSTNR
jgi:hypothetical protein